MSPRGYTLIEAIFALLLVAVLCRLAWAGYESVLRQTHRNQAQARLVQAALWIEHQRVLHGRYADAQGQDLVLPPELAQGDPSHRWNYVMHLRLTETGSYGIEAEPAGWSDPDCGILRLESDGQRHATGPWGSARCWRR